MRNVCLKLLPVLTALLLLCNEGRAACNTTITAVRDTFCLANGDTLTATASGAGATYVWSGGTLAGTSTNNPLIVSALTPGSYTYTVTSTDGTGCTSTASYTLVSNDVTASIFQMVQPSCGRNNGSIQCNIQTSNRYVCSFSLNGSGVIQSGNSVNISNLLPGTYSFTVDDLATGCSVTIPNIVLTDTTTYPTFDNIAVTPENCYGSKNGAIMVTVGNCTSGCGYVWSQNGADNTDSAVGLTAGTYTLSVSKGGCSNIDTTIIVPGPSGKLIDSLKVTPDHCSRHVGTGIVVTHGGTPPYSYAWSWGTPSAPTNDTSRGMAGDTTVFVIITDSHGCKDTTLADSIGNTPGPSARITNVDTICASEHNGVLIVQATSADGPFTYLWSNGSTTTVAGGLDPGVHSVTVTDAVGCDTVLSPVVQAYAAYAYLSASMTTLFQGQTTQLLITTDVPVKDVVWSPYVAGSRGSTEVYDKPQASVQYTTILTYGEACQLFDTVNVTVLTDTSKLIVPNTFTPNGDGINDNFSLVAIPSTLNMFHIWIYDRWGNKVYESTDPNFNWDGTDIFAANKPLNTAVFAYAIEYNTFDSPDKKIIGGNISLVK